MEVVRPAGLNELRCIAREDQNLYGSIISVAEYSGPHELNEAEFTKALKQCVTEHPALAIVIQEADTESPTLVRVNCMDFKKHCYIRFENLRHFLEDIHDEPFTERSTRPQWRVVVQPIVDKTPGTWSWFQLAFVCSHNIADGMSGPQFHATFLRALRNLRSLTFDGTPLWKPPKDSPLPPPLEKASEMTFLVSWAFLLGPLIKEYLPVSVAAALGYKPESAEEVWKGAATRPHQLPLTNLVSTKVCRTSISPKLLGAVLTACKSHNSRLTGLLTHLTARALARTLKSRGQDYLRFESAITINMREAIKFGEGQIANYPSSTSADIAIQPHHLEANPGISTEDWEAVAVISKSLEERSSTLDDQPVALLRYLKDFRGWNRKNASKPAEKSFEVSNVGVVDASPGDWKIKDFVFSQSADASGVPMSVNVASTKGGKLNLAFVWSPGALGVHDEPVFIEEVAEYVARELNHLALK